MSLNQLLDNVVGALSVGTAVILNPFIREWYIRYGASPDELARTLPGDEIVKSPMSSYTRAITIDAPPEIVWGFLAQLGQERGGMYSYELLENVAGCEIHNATRIIPEWQQIKRGDVVRLGPKRKNYPLYKVVQVIPNRALVMETADPKTETLPDVIRPHPDEYVIGVWTLVLDPLKGGKATRLIARGKMDYNRSWINRVLWGVTDAINFVMERKMLVTIKHLAEHQAVTPAPQLA